ncbi:outer membrane protein [Croceicoccus naphthovorans]|uniref:Flagellar motor protein MotB n=1 Tax=Croceicoccus naphthovorans TaxID=1348774 RepID=A0A0G3XET1_9SPHN|nr:outer membrane beta-barrel protein [Croceicoccus naphthovorans]AKM09104.1 flagellar motor protein MotB [Croceicoccus naphthovorans]MBB3991651.1 outer membrane immunogenic protein [Croceicoccus naphthovorans]
MRKFAIGLLAACSVTSVAHAETFSGPFVGVSVSRDAYEVKAEDLDLGGAVISADGISGNGFAGGIYAGYDYLIGSNVFFGVEANANLSGASMLVAYDDGFDEFGAKIKAKEGFGLSGRLGYKVADRTGIYARAGWQTTKFKASASQNGTTLFSDSDWQDAFVYGGGIETALGANATIRVEYLNEDYGSAGINSGFGINGIRVDNGKVALGLSYGF